MTMHWEVGRNASTPAQHLSLRTLWGAADDNPVIALDIVIQRLSMVFSCLK